MHRVVLGFVLSVLLLPSARAADPVQLAWRLAPGDRFALVVELSLDTQGGAMGVALTASRTARIEGELVVGEVGSDKARVTFAPSRMILHRVAGKVPVDRDLGPAELSGTKLAGRLTARGVLDLEWDDVDGELGDELEALGVAKLFAGLFGELPKKPVAVGDTWTADGEGVLDRAAFELTVAKVDPATSLVEITGKPKAKSTSVKVPGGHSAQITADGTATATFDTARGHLVAMAESITVTTEGTAGGVTGKVEAKVSRKVSIGRK